MTQQHTTYGSDEEIVSIATRLLDRTLPKSEWTHAAHCAAAIYFLKERPEVDLAAEMPDIIRSYNEASGTENTDTGGYHDTITQFYIRAIRHVLGRLPANVGLSEVCNRLLGSAFGARTFPLEFYSKERLFSVEARRDWVEPDLKPLDFAAVVI